MKFDKTVRRILEGESIYYGFIFGNKKIVFIKGGAGGTLNGYDNKYLKMAHRIHEKIGATVICATNPVESVTLDEKAIRWCVEKQGILEFELYLVGTSDGAYSNLVLGKRFKETKKFLGINTSFITLEDFEDKLNELYRAEKILVYGTKDDEYPWVLKLRDVDMENIEFMIADGADHSFKGMADEFVALIDLL